MKKFLIAFFIFIGLLVSMPQASAYTYKNPITAETLIGRWIDYDHGSRETEITRDYVGSPIGRYYVTDIIREGNHTILVLKFTAGGTGEYWFSNDNPNYIVLKMFPPSLENKYPNFQYYYYTRVS